MRKTVYIPQGYGHAFLSLENNTVQLFTLSEHFYQKYSKQIRFNDADYAEVEYLVRESFWNVYRPGCLEHYVLHCLRENKDFVPELDFVMEKDSKIIGQNIFVRAHI